MTKHSKEFIATARDHARRSDGGDAFLRDPGSGPARVKDDLAEDVAESFLQSATSGEDAGQDRASAEVPEEDGGPFVITSASKEFAYDVDASNPKDAEPAGQPTANATSD